MREDVDGKTLRDEQRDMNEPCWQDDGENLKNFVALATSKTELNASSFVAMHSGPSQPDDVVTTFRASTQYR
jgi:hypothetical protein